MSTVGDLDPSTVIPGMLTVKNGVPSRNGERRARVVDGPSSWSPKVPCSEFGSERSTARCARLGASLEVEQKNSYSVFELH